MPVWAKALIAVVLLLVLGGALAAFFIVKGHGSSERNDLVSDAGKAASSASSASSVASSSAPSSSANSDAANSSSSLGADVSTVAALQEPVLSDFEQNKAVMFQGEAVTPDFSDPSKSYHDFHTRIMEGVKAGANFGGHYSVIEFGCGTECGTGFIVDLANGSVFDLPWGGENYPELQTAFKPDSRLMVARFELEDESSNQRFCEQDVAIWNDSGAKIISKTKVKLVTDSDGYQHDCPEFSQGISALLPEDAQAQGGATPTESSTTTQAQGNEAASSTHAPAPAFAPSFDCAKADNGAERLICSNADLASADVKMAQAYKAALASSSDRASVKASQHSWVTNVRDACSDVACMSLAYQDRIAELSQLAQSNERASAPADNAVQTTDTVNVAQPSPSTQMEPTEGNAASGNAGQTTATQSDAGGQPAPVANAPQAPTPDSEYYRRANSECARGFFGKFCRHNIRQQVCANIWPGSPGASVCKNGV